MQARRLGERLGSQCTGRLLVRTQHHIRLHFTAKQIQAGTIIADSAVGAAEQMAAAGIIDAEHKKLEALAAAKVLASKAGISLSDDQWSLLIEAAVKVMKDSESELKRSLPSPADAGAT